MPTPGELLLVPGLGLGPEAWHPTLRALDGWGHTGSTVVPLPGYGVPAGSGTSLAPRALAEALLDRLPGEGRTVLFGHSASCQVVVHAADLAGEEVAGLVLVGPTTDPRAATWPRLARRWLATARHEEPRQVPLLVRQYHRTRLRHMARAMDLARRDDIAAVLSGIRRPVLVLRGREDRICPPDWAEALAGGRRPGRAAPRSVVTLPAGGHMVPLTHGQLVAEAVRRFLPPAP